MEKRGRHGAGDETELLRLEKETLNGPVDRHFFLLKTKHRQDQRKKYMKTKTLLAILIAGALCHFTNGTGWAAERRTARRRRKKCCVR